MRKRTGLTRIGKITALTGAAVVVAASSAVAHTAAVEDGAYDNAKATHGHDAHQHGGTEGHIDVANYGLDLVSKLKLSRVVEGKIADVGVFKDTAYLAAWGGSTCKHNGVHVVDIADVNAPAEIAFIPSKEGSYPGEGVQALEISTPSFRGDILVTNNEKCRQPAGFGGMNIYDVSDPANPEVLTQGFGDAQGHNSKQSAHQTHSVFAWQDGAKAYAAMVDNEEAADIDIVDISDPRKPVLVAEYDLAAQAPGILQPGLDEVFLHDMVVKQIGGRQIMLASYWDGGYVKLDVTNDGGGVPTTPRVLGDSDFPDPDSEGAKHGLTTPDGTPVPPEGNAHQAEFTGDNAFVIGADEDFSPFATVARNTTDGTDLALSSGSDTKKLEPGTEITGRSRFVGRACNGDPAVLPGDASGTQIAVVERGLCTFTEKVANVISAGGYQAVVIFNRTGSDGCNNSLGMSVRGDIHTFGVAPREQGFDMFDQPFDEAACLAGDGSQLSGIELGKLGDTLKFGSYFDGWGYVRLLNASDMSQVDTYAIPEAHQQAKADGFGDLSVHEVAVSQQRNDLAFLSYYAGGVRAITVGAGGIEEVGAFIDEGGNNFWGVEVFQQGGQEYVALSDRDFGLYIMKLGSPQP